MVKCEKCDSTDLYDNKCCILHCDKSKWSAEKTEKSKFWFHFKQKYNGAVAEYENIVFPKFNVHQFYNNNSFFIKRNNDTFEVTKDITFRKCVFSDDSDFGTILSVNYMIFDRCVFNGDFSLTSASQLKVVIKNHSVFRRNVLLSSTEGNVQLSIAIEWSTFDASVSVKAKQVTIDNSIFNMSFDYGSSKLTVQDSRFLCEISVIERDIQSFKNTYLKKLQVKNWGYLSILGCKCDELLVSNDDKQRKFSNIDITLTNAKRVIFKNLTYINDSSTKEKKPNINIANVSELLFDNINVQYGFKLKVDNAQKVEIINSKFHTQTDFTIGNISHFILRNLDVSSDIILCGQNSYIDSFDIKQMKIFDNTDILFRDIRCSTLRLENIISMSKYFKMHHFNVVSTLIMSDLIVSNLMLSSFHMSNSMCNIVIKDSTVMNIGFNNVSWGRNLEKVFNSSLSPNMTRDVCRQLKKALESQGNIIDSNRFYALEMRAYGRELKSTTFDDLSKDRLIFWLGENTSNFAQDWFMPLYWMLIIACYNILYIENYDRLITKISTVWAFVASTSIVSILLVLMILIRQLALYSLKNEKTISLLFTLIITFMVYGLLNKGDAINVFFFEPLTEILHILNPVEKLNEDNQHKITWYLTKFSLAFLLYQFVVATRRQTKR